ncbi:hypothetical protein AUJ14_03960 [Candidatus Micrarchaeota archaeon CG1_02_55_22]|nr:MAG: hypothetical protein AUJ14_03960 [Candidatus Micrarchaeota archaeon CG1_02_55_22]
MPKTNLFPRKYVLPDLEQVARRHDVPIEHVEEERDNILNEITRRTSPAGVTATTRGLSIPTHLSRAVSKATTTLIEVIHEKGWDRFRDRLVREHGLPEKRIEFEAGTFRNSIMRNGEISPNMEQNTRHAHAVLDWLDALKDRTRQDEKSAENIALYPELSMHAPPAEILSTLREHGHEDELLKKLVALAQPDFRPEGHTQKHFPEREYRQILEELRSGAINPRSLITAVNNGRYESAEDYALLSQLESGGIPKSVIYAHLAAGAPLRKLPEIIAHSPALGTKRAIELAKNGVPLDGAARFAGCYPLETTRELSSDELARLSRADAAPETLEEILRHGIAPNTREFKSALTALQALPGHEPQSVLETLERHGWQVHQTKEELDPVTMPREPKIPRRSNDKPKPRPRRKATDLRDEVVAEGTRPAPEVIPHSTIPPSWGTGQLMQLLRTLGFERVKNSGSSHNKYKHPDGRTMTIKPGRDMRLNVVDELERIRFSRAELEAAVHEID